MEICDDDEPKRKIRKTAESNKAAEIVCGEIKGGDGVKKIQRKKTLDSEIQSFRTESKKKKKKNEKLNKESEKTKGEKKTPKRKKQKTVSIDDVEDSIFINFFADDELYKNFMKCFKKLLVKPKNGFLPSVIQSCDGAVNCARYGRSFSECECIADTQDCDAPYHFGSFFLKSVKIYRTLKKKKIPKNQALRVLARRLLTYILEEREWHEELFKLQEADQTSETEVMVILSEHFFKRLSLVGGYIMDKHTSKRDFFSKCECGKCSDVLIYDDTSLGNKDVWHGDLDVVFDSCGVVVNIAPEINPDGIRSPDSSSPGAISQIEFKKFENIDTVGVRNKIHAQTIMWSFLQKQRHPCFKHYLVPSIVANNNHFKVFCYDAQNDILLESRSFKFSYTKSIRYVSTIAAWTVLNYKFLCTGIFEDCIEIAPKCKFRELVGDSISIYEKNLAFQHLPQIKSKLKKPVFKSWETCRTRPWAKSLGPEPE